MKIEKEADYDVQCSCGEYKIVSGYEMRKQHFTGHRHEGHHVEQVIKIGAPK